MLDNNNNEFNEEKIENIDDVLPKSENDIPEEEKENVSMELYDWLQCFIAPVVIGVLIFVFVFRVITVVGSSMYPTLLSGDRVITSGLFYTPKNGDVVVLKAEDFSDDFLVKRVIAVEGQTIDIDFKKGIVYVDGQALDEPYVASPTYDREDFSGEMTVPENCVFVMGDNRNASTDSRTTSIGMVDERAILGKVLLIAFPGKDLDGNREPSRFGSIY